MAVKSVVTVAGLVSLLKQNNSFRTFFRQLLFTRFLLPYPPTNHLFMPLVAYRPEYRIYLDETLNHLVYERMEELTLAPDLPFYLSDIRRALSQVQPGFTLLCDLRRTLGPNLKILPLFQASRELLQQAGVGMVVEVHSPQPSMRRLTQMLRRKVALPTHQFTTLEEAEAFLHEFRLSVAY